MNVLISVEDHLWRKPDGSYWVRGPAGYASWSELLTCFDDVVIAARVREGQNGSGGERVDGPCVSVHELPDYVGPLQYLRELPKLRRRIREAVVECDAYLLQVPGLIGRLFWQAVRRAGKPYAVNAMGDPWDALGPGTSRSLLRPIYRRIAARNMRAICRNAQAVLYWSHAIERRYPASANAYSAVAPRIILTCGYATQDVMRERRERTRELNSVRDGKQRILRLGFMGSLEQLYKGPDVLIRAVLNCSTLGLEVELQLAGEGRYRRELEKLARSLSIEGKVLFLGHLEWGNPVFEFLDSLDLFVMPSRTEGLPRALVEAMARGCPCIASDVGGIPELLRPDDLVPPGDPQRLAAKLVEVTSNPERLMRMSSQNLEKAKQFDPDALKSRRQELYCFMKVHAREGAARDEDSIVAATRGIPLQDR